MLFYATAATAIALVLPLVSLLIFFKSSSATEKSSPFECGFEPVKSARSGFSLKFFLLAVLFLIFDVEIALLIPAPLSTSSVGAPLSVWTFILFAIILVLGLIYEWKNGVLVWAN